MATEEDGEPLDRLISFLIEIISEDANGDILARLARFEAVTDPDRRVAGVYALLKLAKGREASHWMVAIRVRVPAMYYSGSLVMVEVSFRGGKISVSDMGNGHGVATIGGASASCYDTVAAETAASFGIKYTGYDFLAKNVPAGHINGAITVVANASVQAANIAAMRWRAA